MVGPDDPDDPEDPDFLHVIPVDDLRPHTASADCWCSPTLLRSEPVYVHHSADGREKKPH